MFRSFDLLVSNVRYVYFKLFEWLKWSVGIMPKGGVGSRKIYLIVHYAAVALIALLLAYFSEDIDKLFPPRSTDYLPYPVRRCWWGILFLIAYATVKLTVYLLELLGVRDDAQFPDIEADWDRALDALDRERIDLLKTPIYLVNGLTSAEQKAVLAGGDTQWAVEEPPLSDPNATVRVLADHRAAFVCCTKVSATTAQRANRTRGGRTPSLGGGAAAAGASVPPASAFATQQSAFADGDSSFGFGGGKIAAAPTATAPTSTDVSAFASAPSGTSPAFGTEAPAAGGPDLQEDTVRADAAFDEEPPLPGGGLTRTLSSLFASMPGGADRLATKLAGRPGSSRGGAVTPLSEEEINAELLRLEFVCELIMGERGDEVPVDGLLQGVPVEWAASQGGRKGSAGDHAAKLAESVGRDVACVHDTFELQMPVVAVLTGMDRLPGFKDFLGRCGDLTPQLRQSRAGQSFGVGADVTPEAAGWLADGVYDWFRGWTYKAFCRDPSRDDNRRLFQMLAEVGRRREAVAAALRRSFEEPDEPAVRLYGCYAAATGPSEREQGFTRGVLDKLVEARHDVAWDPVRVRSASREALYTTLCFVLAGLFLIGAAYLWFAADWGPVPLTAD